MRGRRAVLNLEDDEHASVLPVLGGWPGTRGQWWPVAEWRHGAAAMDRPMEKKTAHRGGKICIGPWHWAMDQ